MDIFWTWQGKEEATFIAAERVPTMKIRENK
jgi:hypothetical protein